MQRRARQCLSIAAEVHCASNLTDFEQRVKRLVAPLFNVVGVRLSFYDDEAKDLVTTSMGSSCAAVAGKVRAAPIVGRRNVSRYPIREGITGRCLRTGQVYNIERIMASPHVSEGADGVDLAGRAGDVNMLAGPMVAQIADDSFVVIGVLQLLEKRNPSDAEATLLRAGAQAPLFPPKRSSETESRPSPRRRPAKQPCEPFTADDEDFFKELLKILGLAAYRAMQVQTCASMPEMQTLNVGKMLETS